MRGGVNGGRGGRGAGSTMNLREEQVGCDKDSGGLLTAEERERGIAFPWSADSSMSFASLQGETE